MNHISNRTYLPVIQKIGVVSLALLFSCSPSKKSGTQHALPPVIIYKTTADYSRFVPVTMNPEKTAIVSYPAPGDVFYEGELAKPTSLIRGYWLDHRGVGPHSVYTSYTWEEYASLKSAPSTAEIMERVTDKDPFTEMYRCKELQQGAELKKTLNKIIRQGVRGCSSLLDQPK